jgi:hypothetical protein
MIVPIDKHEIEVTREICALTNCVVDFYTIETNPNMVRADIKYYTGVDISAEDAWMLRSSIMHRLTTGDLKGLE